MRTKRGIITSAKMQNTVVVTVHAYRIHPKYQKRYRVSSKFFAHNPGNKHQEGEEVTIRETRPLSKMKRWEIVEEQAS